MIDLDNWRPLTVEDVHQLFSGAPFDWCLAGGHALEQFVGRPLRAHDDIDVVVFRDQQVTVRAWLRDWRLYAADPPGKLRLWPENEYLPVGIHDIWGHRPQVRAWELQIMLQEVDDQTWIFRRDDRIRGSRASLIDRSGNIPLIRAEIQLLYKAHHRLSKDEVDFRACLPLLEPGAKEWLRTRLELLYPAGHPWRDALRLSHE